jgi:serine/threonine protein kinase
LGSTAEHYRRLSDAGLAPAIVRVTHDEIVVVRHRTLEDWLRTTPPQERVEMKEAIRALLLAAHAVGLCHRDVHVGNLVLTDDERPLLIDFALATPSVNGRCYDLEGPEASRVPVPPEHLREPGHERGVWWGSPVRHRSLELAFGPPVRDAAAAAPA